MLLSSSIYSASEWLYYKQYPWVYDAKTEDWLYLQGGTDRKIYAYRASTKVWEEFSVNYVINWDKQYSEWLKNPDAFGGKEVLEQIKNAKDSNSSELWITYPGANFDITPVGGLSNLKILGIFVRLGKRDSKPSYLKYLPYIWKLLELRLKNPIFINLKYLLDKAVPKKNRKKVNFNDN